MILNTGSYIIIKHAFWTRDTASIIFIKSIDGTDVRYYYPEENRVHLRRRFIADFESIEIVPVTSLLLELI
jgi:hypothetical protein